MYNMKHINILFCTLWILSMFSCKRESEPIKHYDAFKQSQGCKENIHEIDFEDVEISTFGRSFYIKRLFNH